MLVCQSFYPIRDTHELTAPSPSCLLLSLLYALLLYSRCFPPTTQQLHCCDLWETKGLSYFGKYHPANRCWRLDSNSDLLISWLHLKKKKYSPIYVVLDYSRFKATNNPRICDISKCKCIISLFLQYLYFHGDLCSNSLCSEGCTDQAHSERKWTIKAAWG